MHTYECAPISPAKSGALGLNVAFTELMSSVARAKSKRLKDQERNRERLQMISDARTQISEQVNKKAFHDNELSEIINKVPYHDVISLLIEKFPGVSFTAAVPWWLQDDNDCGQVLTDGRGRGAFQMWGRGCLQITR